MNGIAPFNVVLGRDQLSNRIRELGRRKSGGVAGGGVRSRYDCGGRFRRGSGGGLGGSHDESKLT